MPSYEYYVAKFDEFGAGVLSTAVQDPKISSEQYAALKRHWEQRNKPFSRADIPIPALRGIAEQIESKQLHRASIEKIATSPDYLPANGANQIGYYACEKARLLAQLSIVQKSLDDLEANRNDAQNKLALIDKDLERLGMLKTAAENRGALERLLSMQQQAAELMAIAGDKYVPNTVQTP